MDGDVEVEFEVDVEVDGNVEVDVDGDVDVEFDVDVVSMWNSGRVDVDGDVERRRLDCTPLTRRRVGGLALSGLLCCGEYVRRSLGPAQGRHFGSGPL